jgi:hypothetical protein
MVVGVELQFRKQQTGRQGQHLKNVLRAMLRAVVHRNCWEKGGLESQGPLK